MLEVNNKNIRMTPYFSAGMCLIKLNNRDKRTLAEICSKLTMKTPERRK